MTGGSGPLAYFAVLFCCADLAGDTMRRVAYVRTGEFELSGAITGHDVGDITEASLSLF